MNKMFYLIKDEFSSNIEIKLPRINIIELTKDSSIGKQIKYYRKLANLKQEDLSLKLGCSKEALQHIENREMKLVDINLLKKIIKELDIEDKININDDYIKFLLNNPSKTIFKLGSDLGQSREEFSKRLNISITSVRR